MSKTWPLILPHTDATRINKPRTTQLLLTRKTQPHQAYELHDALIVRRNERHRQHGRHDLQQDPTIITITITTITPTTLIELTLKTVRAAGYDTQRDFYDNWLQRRHHINPHQPIYICQFQPADVPRLLHRRAHRGYTSDPAQAIAQEPEALTELQLRPLVKQANQRDEDHKQARRQATPRADRIEEVERRAREGDRQAQRHLFVIDQRIAAAEKQTPRKAA